MILLSVLNDNFTDCNENLGQGKQELLVHSYVFLTEVWHIAHF